VDTKNQPPRRRSAWGSATWWGLPGLAIVAAGIEGIAVGKYGAAIILLVLGGLCVRIAVHLYRRDGRL